MPRRDDRHQAPRTGRGQSSSDNSEQQQRNLPSAGPPALGTGAGAAQAPRPRIESLMNLANLAANLSHSTDPPRRYNDPSGSQVGGASNASSQGRMDAYRVGLILELVTSEYTVERGQEMMSLANGAHAAAQDPEYVAQARARATFLISEGRARSGRLRAHFQHSYCPLIRDSNAHGIPPRTYSPEILRIIQTEPNPMTRLRMFQAQLQSFHGTTSETDERLYLFSEYVVASDEQRRVLVDADLSVVSNPTSAVEGGTAQPDGGPSFRVPNPRTPRGIPGRLPANTAAVGGFSQASSSPSSSSSAQARNSPKAGTSPKSQARSSHSSSSSRGHPANLSRLRNAAESEDSQASSGSTGFTSSLRADAPEYAGRRFVAPSESAAAAAADAANASITAAPIAGAVAGATAGAAVRIRPTDQSATTTRPSAVTRTASGRRPP